MAKTVMKFAGAKGVCAVRCVVEGDSLTLMHHGKVIAKATGQVFVWDSGFAGLGIRFTKRKKSYVYQGRVAGKTRRVTLGDAAELTPTRARDLAAKAKIEMRAGIERDKECQEDELARFTVGDAIALYLDHPEFAARLKPRTKADARYAFKPLGDWLGKPVRDLTGQEVIQRHKKLSKRSPIRANITMRYLRAALNHAHLLKSPDVGKGKPLFDQNPVERLGRGARKGVWNKSRRRRTYISDQDFPKWWAALDRLGGKYGEHARDYFRFLALTGCRPSEAYELRWDDVDFAKRTVLFRDTKNGTDHELPCGKYLINLLLSRRPIAGEGRVFSHADGTIPVSIGSDGVPHGYFAYNVRALRRVSGVSFVPTDLRRLVATVCVEEGLGMMTAKAILNHTSGDRDVTAGYTVLPGRFIAEAMQVVESAVLARAR